MRIIVFEDKQVLRLYPMAIARPAYAISCGSYRLVDWLRKLQLPLAGIVRPYLAAIQEQDFPDFLPPTPGDNELVMLVNARLVPSYTNFRSLQKLAEANETGIIQTGDAVAAIITPLSGNDLNWAKLSDLLARLTNSLTTITPGNELTVFSYSHDLIRENMKILTENLDHRLADQELTEVADGLFVGEGVKLPEYYACDTSDGVIVLDDRASVGPFSYLSGPGYVGQGSRLIEHSSIKDGVSIAHTVKIGGEVEASIIEPYTNKQHYGFLGHSYLGSWINLGAGTCNSDLKNTYGKINMEYPAGRVASDMQFVGCMVGDYSKSAINTGIFTGKTIGVCSMLYGFITTNVPSFVNYARLFGQVTEIPPDVMISTQQRMFSRRNVEQRPCDIQLLQDMYELTRSERQIDGDQLSL
jgi:UDP-N-acetylglucosamine diphosphorylase/glucosamine-1-phosphate N-acetyltransferase